METQPTHRAQTPGLARRATSDEIRRQPEFQYLTSWASPCNRNSIRGMLRPHTAGATELAASTARQRSFSLDTLKCPATQRFIGANSEKGILRSHQNGDKSQHKFHFRRFSSGPLYHEKHPGAIESVYKSIDHLFHKDSDYDEACTKIGSGHNVVSLGRQSLTSRKKVIRFLDARDNPRQHITGCKVHIGASDIHELKNDESCPKKVLHESSDKADDLVHTIGSYRETSLFSGPSREANCSPSQSKDESLSDSPTEKSNGFVCHEKDGGCGTTEKVPSKVSVASANVNSGGQSCTEDICNDFKKLSTQPSDQTHISKKTVENPKDNERNGRKNVFRGRRPKTGIERSNSNYDADLEKCDQYLRAQSSSFTQTSQYMSNTKRGLSQLSMHYSQTNTAHNDRVIMSDLLRNGHTRNALIGDSVYAIERRLYNRRRDPLKSTTFYERFANQTQNSKVFPTRKRKSRTVADRAKERQERINKKKEELERGFPPRAWSLVEVGAEDIEHMLNTCRYLRVDIRKQPNVYGIVDLSDEA